MAKGCVARCTFCHRWEKGYRVGSTDRIINHILDLQKKYKVGFISIGDENFGSYKKETIELVKKLGDLGFKWGAAGVRAHTVDYEMLKFWKDNGCEQCSLRHRVWKRYYVKSNGKKNYKRTKYKSSKGILRCGPANSCTTSYRYARRN